jgi:hypothetical protein
MSSTTYSEFEDWLPRPAALRLALALWIAGFAVAGAAATRLHDAAPGAARSLPATNDETTQAPDSTASGGVIVIPEDVVVGHRAPSVGAAMKQKP